MNNVKSYQTKQKRLIQNLFKTHPDKSYSAEEILALFVHNNTPISKSTLYRALDKMITSGDIIKYNFDSGASKYQNKNDNNMIYFKCENCGELFEVNSIMFKQNQAKLSKQYGLEIDFNKTILYGKCHDCKEEDM